MSLINDPDFSDESVGKFEKSAKAPVGPPPVRAWTIVVAANLPVPLFLGVWITNAGSVSGKVGMACGVALIYWLGLRACHRARGAIAAVILGGWFVAASQLYPLLQIGAGLASLRLAGLVASGLGPFLFENPVVQFVAILATTLGTGAILIAVAAVFGFVGRAFLRGF